MTSAYGLPSARGWDARSAISRLAPSTLSTRKTGTSRRGRSSHSSITKASHGIAAHTSWCTARQICSGSSDVEQARDVAFSAVRCRSWRAIVSCARRCSEMSRRLAKTIRSPSTGIERAFTLTGIGGPPSRSTRSSSALRISSSARSRSHRASTAP